MAPISGLTVRQHKRESIELPVQFVVSDGHRSQVRFTTSSAALNQYKVVGIATDLSRGGLGMESRLYVPRWCRGTIRIFDRPEDALITGELDDDAAVLEAQVKVQRVILAGHDPLYAIGMSFVEPSDEFLQRVNELCEHADAEVSERSDLEEGCVDA